MGESACLLRSFSHPSGASRESEEGDPLRALGESISFGRFMTEPLAWEKWSAFSHNRYQEELQKFSKPGSVAQKKAYFEAHYKRKAAQKAAAELEEPNTMVATSQVETEDKSCISSCVDSEPLRPNDQVIETSEQQNFIHNAEIVSPTDADVRDSINVESMSMVETLTDKVEEEVLEQNNSMETAPTIENANQNENVEDHGNIKVAEDVKTLASPAAEKEVRSSGGSLKRLRNYPTKLLTRSWLSKSQSSPAKQATTSSQQCVNRGNATPKSKKHVGNIVEKLTMKSVQMSMHVNPRPKEIGKTSPDLLQVGRKRTHMSSLATSKETSTPPKKIANRAAAPVNGLLKQPLIKPPLENKRCLKSSNASGTERKVRPPLICSPFSFKSEQRVVKRRELFQKLEEKAIPKRWGKSNCRQDVRKERRMTLPNYIKAEFLKPRQIMILTRDQNRLLVTLKRYFIHLIPATRPRSPKLGRKPGSSSAVQNISSLPPKRPSVTFDDSKSVTRKRYGGTAQSGTSLGKKTSGCENSSPNIQS